MKRSVWSIDVNRWFRMAIYILAAYSSLAFFAGENLYAVEYGGDPPAKTSPSSSKSFFCRPQILIPTIAVSAYVISGCVNKLTKAFIRWKYPGLNYSDDQCTGFRALRKFHQNDLPWQLKAFSKSTGIVHSLSSEALTLYFYMAWVGFLGEDERLENPYIRMFFLGLSRHLGLITSPFVQGIVSQRMKIFFESGLLLENYKKKFKKRLLFLDTIAYFASKLTSIRAVEALGYKPFTTIDGGYISLLLEKTLNTIYCSFHSNYRWVSASKKNPKTGKLILMERFNARVKSFHIFLPTYYHNFQLQTVAVSIPGSVKTLFPLLEEQYNIPRLLLDSVLITPEIILNFYERLYLDRLDIPRTLEEFALVRMHRGNNVGIAKSLILSLTPVINFFIARPVLTLDQAALFKGMWNARIDRRKLTKYALNLKHPTGKHKAEVFSSVLGFYHSDADELLKILQQGAKKAIPIWEKSDRFGVRFRMDIPVQGPLGSAVVRTVWIYRPGVNYPELVTLYIR